MILGPTTCHPESCLRDEGSAFSVAPDSAPRLHPLRLFRLTRAFQEQHNHREQRGNRPPEAEANLEHKLWHAGELSNPGEHAPDIRRAGNAKNPGSCASQPQHATLRLALAQFHGAQAHAELRAAGKVRGEWNRRSAQRAQRAVRLPRMFVAKLTILQM